MRQVLSLTPLNRICRFCLCVAGWLLPAAGLHAQGLFKLMRYDERYTTLKDSARTFYNRLKYTPLGGAGNIYISFGGEARVEYAAFNHEDWGKQNLGHNNFLLQRYDLHADLHLGDKVRLFAQLRSGWENGRKNGPRPIDEDKLNVQNLFMDVAPVNGLTFRLGKQELDYGSGRLLSVREGPNLRLHFTGAKMMWNSPRLFIDVFAMAVDTVFTGAFDNRQSTRPDLWGTYGKWIVPRAGNADFYYLGIHRDVSVYEAGQGKETRHTAGGRYWRYGGGFIYNLEAAYQFGRFEANSIHAWTASADLGYMFEQAKGKPTINLRHDYISGDTRKAGVLGTFNPLYPKGGYFGFDPQIGPVNLIDLHPYAAMAVLPQLTVQADVVWNWRYALSDGLYRPSGNFSMAAGSSRQRYIGAAYLASAVYNMNAYLTLNTGIQYFHAGPLLHDLITDTRNGLFINTRLAFKF